MDAAERPIGVFDSGVGGLTVLRALRTALPHECFIYLGDTARLPYGTKSAHTVERYALQAAEQLVAREVKALVVACNTASALALPAMRAHFQALPLIGVVDPGAEAAVAASRSGHIAVIATEATVRGGAYQRAIEQRRPDAQVRSLACQLFVALAEEGWTSGPVARAAAQRYLQPLRASATDTLVLGCTHFPVLQDVIREVIDTHVSIVDSAATTAAAARALLSERNLLRSEAAAAPGIRFLATDGVTRFATVGGRFLGQPIGLPEVELVDL